jgi:type IV secretory pathway TraG/TraD family ATPase VirD4
MQPNNSSGNDTIYVQSGGWYAKAMQRRRDAEFLFSIIFGSFYFCYHFLKRAFAPTVQTEKVVSIGREISAYGEELDVIGVLDSELRKHLHLIGGTGRGKTTLMTNMFIQLASWGRGLIVIDPKGDLVEAILPYIPGERMEDVVIFDPSDPTSVVGFNVFASVPASERSRLASEIVLIFKKITAQGSWGPRLDSVLRLAILALLEVPGSTMLDLYDFLTDEEYRGALLDQVTDRFVRDFWINTFASFSDNHQSTIVSPLLNKIEPWLSYPEARRMLGQPNSTINLNEIMDSGKILLVRIPQGLLGEDLSNLVGALVMTMTQMAVMHRASMPIAQRKLVHFLIDEFQNFTTSSLDMLLSMTRSFGLSVICANQYDAQLTPEVVASLENNCAVRISCELDGFNHLAILKILQDFAKPEVMMRPLHPPHPGSHQTAKDVQLLSQLKYNLPVADVDRMLETKWNLRKQTITVPSRALVAVKKRSETPIATIDLPEAMIQYGI